MKLSINKIRLLFYIAVLIASIVFASFYGGPVSYVWLYAMLLLIPLSVGYTFLSYRNLRIYQELDAIKITKGETHTYRAVFENIGILPIYKMGIYLYTDRCILREIEDGLKLSLHTFSRVELLSDINCLYAGAYYIGIEKLSLADPFGIFDIVLDIPWSFRAIVRPQITDKANAALEIENLINSMGLKSDRLLEEIPGSDMRSYHPGDPLHSINWKISAKFNDLVVRLPDKMEKRTLTLFLLAANTPENSQDIEFLKKRDFFLEFIVSATRYFCEQGVPLRVIYPSGEKKETTINSYQSFMEFYDVLADHIYYGSNRTLLDMQQLSDTRRNSVYENDTWIIIKENPVSGEEFYYICD